MKKLILILGLLTLGVAAFVLAKEFSGDRV